MMAENLARALGARRTGSTWMARCPAHSDREPSLAITAASNGKTLLRCHAGCDQQSVISALRVRGLWTDAPSRLRDACRTHVERKPVTGETERTAAALAIWTSSTWARGTPVERYLQSRGITLLVPETLRFHPRLKHPSGDYWPAMVALVTQGVGGTAVAIHRTFLARDRISKAPIAPQKMMLGPCRRGAVRLARPRDLLMVGEGIETCLAAMVATGHPAWAALSTSGLRALDLPEDARDVIVLADADDAGEAAAQVCALRWKRQGRRVRVARPPRGQDFNDMLLGCAPFEEEGPL
jgi:putative DNA primase/helicase